MSKKGMEILSCFGYFLGFSFQNFEFCEHCVYGKQTQESHRKRGNHQDKWLALVHSDLCGPMPSLSLRGAMYLANFIDEYSCKVWIYFLKHKKDVLGVFKMF